MHAMNPHRLFLGASVIALTLLGSSAAQAGSTSPVSSLATLPPPVAIKSSPYVEPIPGLTLTSEHDYNMKTWHDLTAATGRGYCLARREMGYRWMGTYGTSSRSATEDLDLDRLIEKDGKVTLERTRVHLDPPSGTVTATGRSQVELQEIARTAAGVVVWAYRDERVIVVLAKRVERGVESRQLASEHGSAPLVSIESCPFGGTRLDARRSEAGTFAQLSGNLAAQRTGKDRVTPKFIIDASLSRVARDPEPLIAVRVRVTE